MSSEIRFRPPTQRHPDVRYLGIVYGFNTLDPATGTVRVGYVGQTVQRIGARERQHRDVQPWSDLIVGEAYIIEQGMWTCAELDERERFHISRLRPLYNYDHNLDNPDRIPIPVARQQREARDAARGVVSPVWPAARQVAAPTRTARPSRRRSYRWLLSRPVGYVALWLTLAVGGWTAAVREGVAHGWAGPEFGAVGASLLFMFAMSARKPRRRRRRR